MILMKNTFALSLALIAISGGAGFGLSAFHDFSTSVQTVSLEAPEIINDGSSGFVIPQHVPASSALMSTSALSAPALPALFEKPELTSKTLPADQSPTLAALTGPEVSVETIAPLAAPRKSFAQQTPAPKFIRQTAPQVSSTFAGSKTGAQALNSYDDYVPKNAPKYVVGVYR